MEGPEAFGGERKTSALAKGREDKRQSGGGARNRSPGREFRLFPSGGGWGGGLWLAASGGPGGQMCPVGGTVLAGVTGSRRSSYEALARVRRGWAGRTGGARAAGDGAQWGPMGRGGEGTHLSGPQLCRGNQLDGGAGPQTPGNSRGGAGAGAPSAVFVAAESWPWGVR